MKAIFEVLQVATMRYCFPLEAGNGPKESNVSLCIGFAESKGIGCSKPWPLPIGFLII